MQYIIFLVATILLFSGFGEAQLPPGLGDIAVWTFNANIFTEGAADSALYVPTGYCKRSWFKYDGEPYNYYPYISYIPPILNAGGAFFEGGVQVANVRPSAGWPHDNPYDDDHSPPYRIPPPVFYDFVTRDADGNIYWIDNIYTDSVTCGSIANENYISYVLYWAYQQIDANVNALEFDEISGGYRFSTCGVEGDNPNTGYDDYAIGTANFATRISLFSRNDSLFWQMPVPSAGSFPDSAAKAFDDDANTFWCSDTSDSHWLQIDFGRVRTIQQVYVRFPGERIAGDFNIIYWDGASWHDFNPPIRVSGNTDSICSFLVEPARAERVRFISVDSVVCVSELQLFGQGFRQFLLKRYCVDSGWTATDPRWETEKLVDLSDTGQCPDGTMNTFNYRGYLISHGWTGNPFGGTIDETNFLNPPNPLFLDFLPTRYLSALLVYFFTDSAMLDTLKALFVKSYSYQRLQNIWTTVRDSVREYSASLGRDVFVTTNGSASGFRDGADYLLDPHGGPPMLPIYRVDNPVDTMMYYLDGSKAMLNIYRMKLKWAQSFMDEEVPVVAFVDFGHQGNLFSHLGGHAIYGFPADVRAEYLRIFPAEMYAAGMRFCYPIREPSVNAWLDTLSDGTRLIDVIKQQADFIYAHFDIYRDVFATELETLVTVNGVVPFNGEWNIVGGQFDSHVNESGVTVAYTIKTDSSQGYLHIINHSWDSAGQRIVPQDSVPVTLPVIDSCVSVKVISPDFPDTLYPDFSCAGSVVSFLLPVLEYYDVVILDFGEATVITAEADGRPDKISISLFPNPFNSFCVISAPRGACVGVYTVTGRLLFSAEAGEGPLVWTPSADLPSGVYVVRARLPDGAEITALAAYVR